MNEIVGVNLAQNIAGDVDQYTYEYVTEEVTSQETDLVSNTEVQQTFQTINDVTKVRGPEILNQQENFRFRESGIESRPEIPKLVNFMKENENLRNKLTEKSAGKFIEKPISESGSRYSTVNSQKTRIYQEVKPQNVVEYPENVYTEAKNILDEQGLFENQNGEIIKMVQPQASTDNEVFREVIENVNPQESVTYHVADKYNNLRGQIGQKFQEYVIPTDLPISQNLESVTQDEYPTETIAQKPASFFVNGPFTETIREPIEEPTYTEMDNLRRAEQT